MNSAYGYVHWLVQIYNDQFIMTSVVNTINGKITTIEPLVATLLQPPLYQNIKSVHVKSLYLEPLVGDHLS